MNKLIESVKSASLVKSIKKGAVNFLRDEEGAQIVEYALIIAVVSIALIVLLAGLTKTGGGFDVWITSVTNCLTGKSCP